MDTATAFSDAIFKDSQRGQVTKSLVEFFCSAIGKDLIRTELEFDIGATSLKVNDWAARIASVQEKYSEDLKTRLQPLLPHDVKDLSDLDVTAALHLLGGLRTAGQLSFQMLEVLDNIGMTSSNPLIAAVQRSQGAVAAVSALVVSSTLQATRYYRGQIRWDDAIDRVAGDVIKAGLTGIVVSAAVSALGVSGPGALVVAVPLAVVVYAAVSSVCDWIYEEVLGGREMWRSRRIHVDYRDLADHVRTKYFPLLKRTAHLGALVEHLLNLQSGDVDILVDRADSLLLGWQKRTAQRSLEESGDDAFIKHLRTLLRQWVKGESHLRLEEIKYLTGHVHRLYWRFKDRDRNRRTKELVKEELERTLEGRGEEHAEAVAALVSHLCDMEECRGEAGNPLRFWVSAQGGSSQLDKSLDYLYASDLFELGQFIHALMSKSASVTIDKYTYYAPAVVDADIQKFLTYDSPRWQQEYELNVVPIYDQILKPFARGVDLNRFYQKGMRDAIHSGHLRLFALTTTPPDYPGKEHLTAYITIPGEDERDQQEQSLRRSLERSHPYFRRHLDAVRGLREIKVQDSQDALGITMGVRVIPLELYTGTFKEEEEGRYSSYEGYFNSLKEAYVGFGAENKKLIGVRPGGKILSDSLREKLSVAWKGARRQDLWAVQNALLAKISTGLMLLDELADKDEQTISVLAGSAALVSCWWFFSGDTRRKLVASLAAKTTQLALRMELMESLQTVHKFHIAQSGFFEKEKPVVSSR